MIIGAEIGMLVWGLLALVKGRLVLSKTRVLCGAPARVVALFALLPIPLSFTVGAVLGFVYTAAGQDIQAQDHPFRLTAAGFEFGILVLCLVTLYAIGVPLAGPPAGPKPAGKARGADRS